MNRFFVPPEAIQADEVIVPAEVERQIRRVLRLKNGAHVLFLNNSGYVFETALNFGENPGMRAKILSKTRDLGEPDHALTLFIALTQREKFEWILQKCTEAGVSAFAPVIMERSLVQDKSLCARKKERWQKILQEAAEQCERGLTPTLADAEFFKDAAAYPLPQNCLKIFLWENEQMNDMEKLLSPHRVGRDPVALFVGPEGGFSDAEVQIALQHGWIPATLGKRIYRMETAALAATVIAFYELDRRAPTGA